MTDRIDRRNEKLVARIEMREMDRDHYADNRASRREYRDRGPVVMVTYGHLRSGATVQFARPPDPVAKSSPMKPALSGRRALDLSDVGRDQFCAVGEHRWIVDMIRVGCDRDCICKTASRVCADCRTPHPEGSTDRDGVIARCRATEALLG